MAEEPLRDIIDAMRGRIQAELDAQIQALTARHEESLARARQEAAHLADADAEKRWASRLEAVRAEWNARLQSEVAAERQKPPPRADVDPRSVLAGVQAIEDARSLSEALAALVHAAGAAAPRVALFIVNGTHLDEWSVAGVSPLSRSGVEVDSDAAGVIRTALRRGAMVATASGAAAIPLLIGGQSVAVLYADDREQNGEGAWLPAVELLTRHAAACLAQWTAVRALQLRQGRNGASTPLEQAPMSDDDQGARRYAKLLVSEIKLYNEPAVRAGREHRDLMRRLGPEIDRARRLYEERVSPTVTTRGLYFQQELVQTLAGGDPVLLGR